MFKIADPIFCDRAYSHIARNILFRQILEYRSFPKPLGQHLICLAWLMRTYLV